MAATPATVPAAGGKRWTARRGATARRRNYAHVDPAGASAAPTLAGERMAASFAGVFKQQWGHEGTRSDGSAA